MKIILQNIAEAGIQTCEFNGRMLKDFNEYVLLKKISEKQIALRFDSSKYPIEILIDDNEVTVYFHVPNQYIFSFDVFITRDCEGKRTLKEFIEA